MVPAAPNEVTGKLPRNTSNGFAGLLVTVQPVGMSEPVKFTWPSAALAETQNAEEISTATAIRFFFITIFLEYIKLGSGQNKIVTISNRDNKIFNI
ncbi:hypothetical protein D3C80_1748990 [compost metagenome]